MFEVSVDESLDIDTLLLKDDEKILVQEYVDINQNNTSVLEEDKFEDVVIDFKKPSRRMVTISTIIENIIVYFILLVVYI